MKHDEKKIEEILKIWNVSAGVIPNEAFFEYAEHMGQQEKERCINAVKTVNLDTILPHEKEMIINLINKEYE